eukprot:14578748-Ditylum_brightwellii.AAC.1
MLLQNPQFIEPIHDLLMLVGYWEWVLTADLNMGYYAMHLSPESRKVMRLNTIWGIYKCLVLAMGVSPATDIFQRR